MAARVFPPSEVLKLVATSVTCDLEASRTQESTSVVVIKGAQRDNGGAPATQMSHGSKDAMQDEDANSHGGRGSWWPAG